MSASKSVLPCFSGYFMPPAAATVLCVRRAWMNEPCGCGLPMPQAMTAIWKLPPLTSGQLLAADRAARHDLDAEVLSAFWA